MGPEGDAADLAFEAWVGRCMRAARAGGLGIMDDVSWSNFFVRSLTLGLFAGPALGLAAVGRSLLIGAETERKPGRNGVREFEAVGGGREAWLEPGEDESPRELEAVEAMGASCLRLADEFGSAPL